MAMTDKPVIETLADGSKYWEHTYEKFYLKTYVPKSELDGQINNYSFRAPMLVVFEEQKMDKETAVAFADKNGLARIAADTYSSVLFVYPTCEGGWANATEELYISLIAETKMDTCYEDGICTVTNFFTQEFLGYFIKGAIFRAYIYSYGVSADFVATHLLKTLQGEYLWGPGEITPAMCSMERLSVVPSVERKDIGILSVNNSDKINTAFAGCNSLLVKESADYPADFKSFVRQFKMWCGNIELEPDFDALGFVEDAGYVTVKTSKDNRFIKEAGHKVGYFAYYNKDLFDNGPAPLLVGFHGGGDSSMYLTYVSGWWEVAHRYGFLYVAFENHTFITATETAEVIEELKRRYNIDEHRIYAGGFSMGSGKTWNMFEEYPQMFAGLAPASALFPVKDNPLSQSHGDYHNEDVPVPIFYSGGESSFLPELPCQADSAMERIQYAAEVNKLKARFDMSYEDKDNWAEPIYGATPDRVEKLYDESRGSTLTVRYYDSEDGVCRTAFASVSGQVHECRHHTNETAWKFISQFSR